MENQELMALIGNLESIAEQIKQMAGGETVPTEVAPDGDEAMMSKILKFLKEEDEGMEPASDNDDDDDMIEKGEDGSTASDDSEERIEDQPDTNKENTNEVAKAIASALKRRVQKSKKPTKISPELIRVRKENRELRKAVEGILEGLGIADTIKEQNKIEKEEKTVAMNDQNEIKKTLDYIKEQIGQTKSTPSVEKTEMRKSLVENDGQVLKALFGR